jgi:zinc finger SWIM domain-containing protein 3
MFREKIVNMFTECAYAATQPSFHRKLNALKAEGGQVVVEFLKTLPFKNWANAYFPGKRYGEMYSNVAECFNNWIEEAREQPATKLVDTIRVKIMKMRTDRRAIGLKWKNFLTKDTENKLEMSYNKTRTWNIRPSTEYLYEVNSNPSVTVDLERRTCSCRWWQIDGLPCDHAVAVIQKTQHNLNSFVEPFFHTEMYRLSYSYPIFPIPNIDKPETTSQNMLIRPPLCKKPPGRPANKRIPSRGEYTRRMKCSRCGAFDNHNKRTCKEVMP